MHCDICEFSYPNEIELAECRECGSFYCRKCQGDDGMCCDCSNFDAETRDD